MGQEIRNLSELRNLSDFEYGALKEIGNIGVGNSATSLSRLVHNSVQTRILNTRLELIENVPKVTGISDFPFVGTFVHIEKELNGYILVFFSEDSARALCQTLSVNEGKNLSLETNKPLFEEVSHILAGTFISTLDNFLHIDASISTPYTAYDMFSSILNYVLTEMSCKADFALIFDAEFLVKEKKINGNFVTLLDPASLDYVLKKVNDIINGMDINYMD
ncbi:chemotaxis protein CheC [Methanosarcina sp. KYL-1]|uniref:chemotaxis protein CheC n=1 Tax=Methanosarcina sp. KYL-1 TaxID=2602068 RepID=UPI0021009E28|nr:chemotaxis protein CheC [Methanosarcina sp. KYL-1]MCQ1535954.1 chemotaxis protein CheC [Methanosarcina sp. KYL-1]